MNWWWKSWTYWCYVFRFYSTPLLFTCLVQFFLRLFLHCPPIPLSTSPGPTDLTRTSDYSPTRSRRHCGHGIPTETCIGGYTVLASSKAVNRNMWVSVWLYGLSLGTGSIFFSLILVLFYFLRFFSVHLLRSLFYPYLVLSQKSCSLIFFIYPKNLGCIYDHITEPHFPFWNIYL